MNFFLSCVMKIFGFTGSFTKPLAHGFVAKGFVKLPVSVMSHEIFF